MTREEHLSGARLYRAVPLCPADACVALRQPQVSDVPALADLGFDELVIVESPPADPRRVVGWVSALAERFLAACARDARATATWAHGFPDAAP